MVTHAPLRVVFFGTPDFAVPALAVLLASRHRMVGVVTQPDRPRGRGQQVSASPVKSLALVRGVPVLQPEKMRDEAFVAALRALDADLGVVAAYGRILTDAILAIPRLGMVNVHASLLPRWRGAAPIHRAILAGDTETGVTIMRVVHDLDAGPMMATLREPIGPTQTTGDIEKILATRGAQLVGEVVERMAEGPVPEDPQPSTGVTYADRITKTDAPIFWWRPAAEIHNQVRALNPWPLASTALDGARLLVLATDAGTEAAPAGALPGTVLAASGDRFVVAAGHGTVQLLTVKPEGKRAMAAREFLAGHQVSPGAVLGMIAPARRVALDALSSVSAGADLPDVLARTRERLADERDRSLAAAIVIGTLRWRERLDFHLRQAIYRNLGKLDAIVLEVLRMSLFQLLFLERVPAAAVVDDAVSMVRRGGKTSAGSFVNGVLRTISRTRDLLSLPARPAAILSPGNRDLAIDALHIAGSHPRWLVARWIDRLGLDAASAWVAFNNVEAPLTLRVNRTRAARETLVERLRALGVETVPTRVAPDGLTVVGGNPLRTPMATSGDFLVQDEASQLVPLLMGARPGHRVLDACAAPGGKSLALADALQGIGLLVAADARDRRVALLRRVLKQHGADASLVEHDLHAGAPFGPVFDRVLVDAPCTGLGTLRRDVDIRWRRGPDDPGVAARRQRHLLAEASAVVAPGGRLVYTTCSSEPEENEQVVSAFLDDHPGFRRVPARTLIDEGIAPMLLNPSTGELVTRPDQHGLEYFYAAAVERVS